MKASAKVILTLWRIHVLIERLRELSTWETGGGWCEFRLSPRAQREQKLCQKNLKGSDIYTLTSVGKPSYVA